MFHLHVVQTGSGIRPATYPMGTGVSTRVKRPGREADRSPPTCADVRNTLIYRSILPHLIMVSYLSKHKNTDFKGARSTAGGWRGRVRGWNIVLALCQERGANPRLQYSVNQQKRFKTAISRHIVTLSNEPSAKRKHKLYTHCNRTALRNSSSNEILFHCKKKLKIPVTGYGGLRKFKQFNYLIGTRIRHIPTCSIVLTPALSAFWQCPSLSTCIIFTVNCYDEDASQKFQYIDLTHHQDAHT
jgi:hypothetical protein